jgi:hypothetical protein
MDPALNDCNGANQSTLRGDAELANAGDQSESVSGHRDSGFVRSRICSANNSQRWSFTYFYFSQSMFASKGPSGPRS